LLVSVLSSDPAERPLPRPDVDPLALYAAAIDTSDYVARVAPLVRERVTHIGDLLDVGAGGGQLGQALADGQHRWTAIEPSASMCALLAALDRPPRLLACGWQAADPGLAQHDTVLAATMPAFLETPDIFLACCRAWARRAVVWIVPAQAGPRGLCMAGCLPSDWHGEDETPGVDIVLKGLAPSERPDEIVFADWTFTAIVPDLEELATYLADRLRWPATDGRRPRMVAHLASQAKQGPAGSRLDITRKSAVLIWGKT
jgi:SAM-dependent methyltransferase